MGTILIVDDNKYIHYIISSIFEEIGYKSIYAREKEEVLNSVYTYKPDLVILEKKLKSCDGFEILREIRKNNQITPILMLTVCVDDNVKEESLLLGANAYATKPFDNDDITKTIHSLLKPATAA